MRHQRTLLASVLLASVAVAGCVSAREFNPVGLDRSQLARVSDVCQSQLGLSADEQPINGPGNPDLDTATENHYEGCIASLSRTLQANEAAVGSVRADRACEARGLPDGSPALAQCVLETQRSGPPPAADRDARFMTVSRTARPGSYYSVSPHHQRLMEEDACAALGMNPVGGGFDACVKSLGDTFYSIDNPLN